MAKNEVRVHITGDATKLGAALGTANTKLAAFSGKLKATGAKMKTAGRKMTMGLTLPIVGLGAVAVKTFANFDKAMTNSLSIQTGVSDKMKSKMEGVARDIAKTTTFSATETAEAYYFLASAGLTAEQQIAALPQVAAFAAAGNFDLATATDLATDAQSALGLGSEDAAENLTGMTRVTDVLTKASQLANASVEQFATALTNKAGTALKNTGKSVEEGSAVLAVFADKGIKAEEAGTMLSTMLTDLPKAAVKNADAFSELGVEVFDAEGNMKNMADITENMTTVLGPMSDAERTAALQAMGLNKQVAVGMNTLLGAEDAIRDYQTAMEDAGGTTQSVRDKQLESFDAKLAVLKSQFEDIALTIGPIIIDQFLVPLGEKLQTVADWVSGLTKTQQTWGVAMLGLIAIAGPLLFVLGSIATAVAAISWPVLLVVGVLALLGAGFYLLYQHSAGFQTFVDALWQTIQVWFDWLKDVALPAVINAFTVFFEKVQIGWTVIREKIGEFVDWFNEHVRPTIEATVEAVGAVFEAVAPIIGAVMANIGNMISAFVQFAMPIWSFLFNVMQVVAKTVFGTIKNVIESSLQGIKGIMDFITGIMSTNWSDVWNTIAGTVGNVMAIVSGVVGGALDGIVNLFGGLKDKFVSALSGLASAVAAPFKSMGNAIKSAWNSTIGGKGISIPSVMGFGGASFTIPTLHTGGYVANMKPKEQLAILEAGESVRSVRQESKLQGILAGVGSGGPGTNFYITVNAGMGTDGGEVGREIVDALSAYERYNGAGWRN